MNGQRRPDLERLLPLAGCVSLVIAFSLICLMPILLVDLMHSALERLNLSGSVATLAVVGIVLGSLINLPVFRIERTSVQPVDKRGVWGLPAWPPNLQQLRFDTLIAVNVGGCVIPVALAAWQIPQVWAYGTGALFSLGLVVLLNVVVCYKTAQPVEGIGISLPVFVSPVVAVCATWLLFAGSPESFHKMFAPVAFTAGVLGPLIGADLLHLKDVNRISTGLLSIGGAGTFDGIVLSGVLAAILA